MESNSREYYKVIDYLFNEIHNGSLKMGDRLPTERTLSDQLHISRNSTREALRSLENMGAIECRQGSGNYFTGNISKKFSEMIRLLILIKRISQKDICDFRRTIEKSICNDIIMNGNADIKELEQLLSCSASNIDEETENDRLFHYTLIQASNNFFLIELMDAVCDIYREWVNDVLCTADEVTKSFLKEAHGRIAAAIKQKDRAACEQAIDEHYNIIDKALTDMAK